MRRSFYKNFASMYADGWHGKQFTVVLPTPALFNSYREKGYIEDIKTDGKVD